VEKAPTKHTLPVEELINNKGAGFLVAKEIIELHNGTISINNSFKKKNCIVITLPINERSRTFWRNKSWRIRQSFAKPTIG
jgi:light-regulated signal transduction histidine kinase (bacteriophytochrome)